MDDEIPFDIPENWAWSKVGELFSIVRGITFPSEAKNRHHSAGLVPCATTGSVQNTYNSEADVYISTEYVKRADQWLLPHDIIMSTANSRELVGKSCIWNEQEKKTFGGFLTVLRPVDCVYSNFAYFAFMSIKASGAFLKKATQTTNIANINIQVLSNTLFPLPPLDEQKRIVAKIEELIPLVEEYGKAEEQLSALNTEFPDKLRKSILQQAIQGKLTERDPVDEPASELLKRIRAKKDKLIKEGKIRKEKPLPPITEDEIPFEIPESWEWVRLSEICNISDGTHQTPHYVDHGVPFISAQNVKPYRFIPEIHRDVSEADYLEYNKVIAPAKGDILMTRVGAGIGEAAIIDQDFAFSIYVSLTLIKKYGNEFNMEYLLHVLNSPQGRKLAEKKTLGKGASQGNLNLIFIREFVLPLPPLAEQQRIVDRVNELLAVCNELG